MCLTGKTVAVIGSGLTGLETAEKLAEDGNRLLVVEMLDEIGPGAYFQNLEDVLGRLEESRPEFITSHRLVEVREGEIVLEHVKSGGCTTRQVDAVVLAVGVKSDDRLAHELKSRFPRVLPSATRASPGASTARCGTASTPPGTYSGIVGKAAITITASAAGAIP